MPHLLDDRNELLQSLNVLLLGNVPSPPPCDNCCRKVTKNMGARGLNGVQIPVEELTIKSICCVSDGRNP
jgi:hypothetical protein